MILDDLLFAMIMAGIGLAGAYLRAEYVLWRRTKAVELRSDLSLRELHVNEMLQRQKSLQ